MLFAMKEGRRNVTKGMGRVGSLLPLGGLGRQGGYFVGEKSQGKN